MTVKKAKKIAITIDIIISVLALILLSNWRIQRLGELRVDGGLIIFYLVVIGIITWAVYGSLYDIWISKLIRKEEETAHLKKVNEFIDKLKNSSNGEIEISQKFASKDKILISIVKAFNPIYSAKIEEDDKVDLIVKDRKTKKMICPPINIKDIEYLISNFELTE